MIRNLLIIALAGIVFMSCEKDCDTPVNKSVEELLAAKTWKADEVRLQFSNNTSSYYKRGGGSNTVNYDSDSLKFNLNNTGIYYFQGSQFTTTWTLTNGEKTKMTLVINSPLVQTLYLENIAMTETSFRYSQYNVAGTAYLASVARLPN